MIFLNLELISFHITMLLGWISFSRVGSWHQVKGFKTSCSFKNYYIFCATYHNYCYLICLFKSSQQQNSWWSFHYIYCIEYDINIYFLISNALILNTITHSRHGWLNEVIVECICMSHRVANPMTKPIARDVYQAHIRSLRLHGLWFVFYLLIDYGIRSLLFRILLFMIHIFHCLCLIVAW